MARAPEPYARPRPGCQPTPQRKCLTCGDTFWTQVGLDAHIADGKHDRYTRRWVTGFYSPAGRVVVQETARRLAAVTNARRRRCDACGHTSTPAGVGTHQHYTGHVGWTELEPITAGV